MPTLRVMTYNILFGGVGREQLIRDVVGAIRPDIAVFTEVTASDSFDAIPDAGGPYPPGRTARTRPPGRGARRRGTRGYRGPGSRWPIMQSELHGPPWAPRKWVEATMRPFGGPSVTVHGVHLVRQPLGPFEIWG